jgi:hypothetical protein
VERVIDAGVLQVGTQGAEGFGDGGKRQGLGDRFLVFGGRGGIKPWMGNPNWRVTSSGSLMVSSSISIRKTRPAANIRPTTAPRRVDRITCGRMGVVGTTAASFCTMLEMDWASARRICS